MKALLNNVHYCVRYTSNIAGLSKKLSVKVVVSISVWLENVIYAKARVEVAGCGGWVAITWVGRSCENDGGISEREK